MSDRDALLAAILAQPDEDTPRLVYADSPRIERLTKLALGRSKLTDEDAMAFAASPRKLQLTHLGLWGNKISKSAKERLEQRFGRGVCTYTQPKSS